MTVTGLPDGFTYQKSQFGHILKGLGMEKCWNILWSFEILFPFGMLCQEKHGNPQR
jgi:hypothetical protein